MRKISLIHIAVLCAVFPTANVFADTQSLGTVTSQSDEYGTSTYDNNSKHGPNSAPTLAPGKAPLSATQPTTIISQQYMKDAISGNEDFNQIANLAPGVSGGFTANGPGAEESKLNMRGFSDGQFNMTYDGIPFGDTNDFSHHSTSYFPPSTIDHIVVDRGPGDADTVGYATFGGSINLFSPNPTEKPGASMGFLYGSYNTLLFRARANSGAIPWLGGARYVINYQHSSSDGYQTFSPVQGDNILFKMLIPLGENTLLTAFTTFNWNQYYQSDATNGLTLAQADLYGKNFALGNNPNNPNYYGYNLTKKHTGMSYLKLQSALGAGFSVEDTVYYYFYHNSTLSSSSSNPTAVGLSNVVLANGKKTLGMPGYDKLNGYWDIGNILKVHKDWSFGRATAGLWTEYASTDRHRFDYNLLNGTPNYDQKPVPGVIDTINNVQFDQQSGFRTVQPFAQFVWRPVQNLRITPGVKYVHFSRSVSAPINQSSRVPTYLGQSYNATLPFFTVNYRFSADDAAYAQFARGFLAPPLSVLQTANAAYNDLKPSTTTNYQVGFVHQSGHWAWDADLYYIDYQNAYAVLPSSPTSNPIYYNQGGVIYKGAEAEGTYAVGNGLALYANGSLNSAKSKETNLTIAQAPLYTLASGVLFNHGPYHASIIYKRTGKQYLLPNAGYPIGALNNVNLKLGYTFFHPLPHVKKIRVNFSIYNLTDGQSIYKGKVKSPTPSPADTFYFRAPRTFYGSISASF